MSHAVSPPAGRERRALAAGGLPAFGVSLLLFWEVLLLALLFAPASDSALGAFAEEFRIWCFGYDPATGRLAPSLVLAMTTPPLLLAAMVAFLWWEPLRTLGRGRAVLAPIAAAALAVAGAAASFGLLATAPPHTELPFPAEALRTALPPPTLALTDHTGAAVTLSDARGQVVLLTAIYASCGHTCPAILAQTKSAVAGLSSDERAGLRVVAVTLDPAHDTPEVLAGLARMQGLEAPLYRLATGEPARVERVLDQMEVARERSPETGVIDHANVVLLLDRAGRVAYRFSVGERQQRWLASALHVLLREPADAG
jgi:protein SCO1/2